MTWNHLKMEDTINSQYTLDIKYRPGVSQAMNNDQNIISKMDILRLQIL
jgi:hypothetical protein